MKQPTLTEYQELKDYIIENAVPLEHKLTLARKLKIMCRCQRHKTQQIFIGGKLSF